MEGEVCSYFSLYRNLMEGKVRPRAIQRDLFEGGTSLVSIFFSFEKSGRGLSFL